MAASATEAVLSDWCVDENAEYAAADAIATVETDKANVDIEAESAGVILKYLVAPGTTVEVGAPIALTGHPGESVSSVDRALRDLGVSVEEGLSSNDTATLPLEENAETTHGQDRSAADVCRGVGGQRLFVAPLVRRLAREANLDLSGVVGTGPNGRIVKRDIAGVLTADKPPAPDVAPAATRARSVAAAPLAVTPQAGTTDTPHSRMRRAIASRLTFSKQNVPHFYVRGSAQVDDLLALREQLNDAGDVKISVNDLIVKAAARAHTRVPAMNVIWLDEAVRSFDAVDIGIAVASDRGLMTPVVHDVARRGIAAVAVDIRDLAGRAREGSLKQEEIEGGSLTISNLGMYGIEEFSAIINPPQAAILAIGGARPEPVVIGGQLAVGSVLRVTLSVDHRPVDGAVAAEWMEAFLDLLHAPMQILM